MITFDQARVRISRNDLVLETYNLMLQQAQDYLEQYSIEYDKDTQLVCRKVSLIDHYRNNIKPGTDLTDQEIIDKFMKLNEKYEDDK